MSFDPTTASTQALLKLVRLDVVAFPGATRRTVVVEAV